MGDADAGGAADQIPPRVQGAHAGSRLLPADARHPSGSAHLTTHAPHSRVDTSRAPPIQARLFRARRRMSSACTGTRSRVPLVHHGHCSFLESTRVDRGEHRALENPQPVTPGSSSIAPRTVHRARCRVRSCMVIVPSPVEPRTQHVTVGHQCWDGPIGAVCVQMQPSAHGCWFFFVPPPFHRFVRLRDYVDTCQEAARWLFLP